MSTNPHNFFLCDLGSKAVAVLDGFHLWKKNIGHTTIFVMNTSFVGVICKES